MEHAAVPSMIRERRLNRWIEDYSDSIMRTCFLYLSDQTQAEDATQDTWIKAWKHMDDFERKALSAKRRGFCASRSIHARITGGLPGSGMWIGAKHWMNCRRS